MKTPSDMFRGRIWILLLLSAVYSSFFINAQIFHDDLNTEREGEFSSKCELIQSHTEIATVDGKKAIRLDNTTIIKPDSGNTDYLANSFILGFEAYFDEITESYSGTYYRIRSWDGILDISDYENENGSDSVHPIRIFRYGAKLYTKDILTGKGSSYDEYKDELGDRFVKRLDRWCKSDRDTFKTR